jgi:anti-anti-sigma regulatory factor
VGSGRILLLDIGDARVVRLVGVHGAETAIALEDEIALQFYGAAHVVVDLSDAVAIDPAIVGALAAGSDFARSLGCARFGIVAPPESDVGRLLDLVNLRLVLPAYATLDDALRAATPLVHAPGQ